MTGSDAAGPPTEPEDPGRQAMDAALGYLSHRPRTRREVRNKLRERGFDDGIIADTLARLDELDLVNDTTFVESYVRDRIALRPMGVRRMLQELYQKGIGRERALPVIERVLAEQGVDERTLAGRVADKKLRILTGRREDERSLRRRLRGHLARRGFSHEVCRDVTEARIPRAGS